MREYITLIEKADNTASLKKNIIDLVKTTDQDVVLNRVLKVLQAGNLDERIVNVLQHDADAKDFIKKITDSFIHIEAPIEEKDKFLEKFPKGIINTKKLLDGKTHTIEDLVGDGFSTELFKDLSTKLTAQGVGPSELALSVMSPQIKWTGRTGGGGDILVNGKPVEVKTRVSSGGRWINPRKAKMDLERIRETIEQASGIPIPDRLNVDTWVNKIRPNIDKKNLTKVTKTIADSIFKATNTSAYQKALATGSAEDIVDEHLRTGYNNYKALSGFEGILMVDLPTDTIQYFKDYDSMSGNIKNDAVYIYAPEGEMMPKVTLTSGAAAAKEKALAQKADTADTTAAKPAQKEIPLAKAASQITNRSIRQKAASVPVVDVGRQKRKK